MNPDRSVVIAELDRLATTVSIPKGTILFQCGKAVAGVFVVRRGAVRMSLDDASHLYPPRILGPGEIAGLPATLTGTYSLTAQVIEDAELGFIPAPRVTELFASSPQLCFLAMHIISEEIARTRSVLKDGSSSQLPSGGALAIG